MLTTEAEVIMHECEPWLQKWYRELLARYDPTEYDAFVDPQVTPAVLTSGWLGFPGVSEGQLAELEARVAMPSRRHIAPLYGSPMAFCSRAPRLSLILMVLTLAPASLAAQGNTPEDSSRVLLLEWSFTSPTDSAVAVLKKGVMYWAEVDGPGIPDIRSARRYGQSALVVDADATPIASRRFEVHVGQPGPYVVRLPGLPSGQVATFKLYRDDVETKRFADSQDRNFTIGILFGGGGHTGYRLEPSAGDPRGGRQFEGGIVTQSGSWFSALLGVSRQSVHDPDFAVAWFFLEPRARVASGRFLGSRRSELAVTLRVGAAPETGPHHLPPNVIAPGITLTHHLSSDGRRRGVSIYTAWRHGWIGNVPEIEHRTTDEFTAGLAWIP